LPPLDHRVDRFRIGTKHSRDLLHGEQHGDWPLSGRHGLPLTRWRGAGRSPPPQRLPSACRRPPDAASPLVNASPPSDSGLSRPRSVGALQQSARTESTIDSQKPSFGFPGPCFRRAYRSHGLRRPRAPAGR
jgi:hypothetical protein